MASKARSVISDVGWRAIAERYGLTARQVDIVRLVCQALTNPGIAEELGVTVDTVRMHLKDVFRKVGTDSRLKLALECVRVDRAARAKLKGAPHDEEVAGPPRPTASAPLGAGAP